MVKTDWKRISENEIELMLTVPAELKCDVVAPSGYTVNGETKLKAENGIYLFKKN